MIRTTITLTACITLLFASVQFVQWIESNRTDQPQIDPQQATLDQIVSTIQASAEDAATIQDYWSNQLRVTYDNNGDRWTTSAGLDGAFDTSDDLSVVSRDSLTTGSN